MVYGVVGNKQNTANIFSALRVASKLALAVPKAQRRGKRGEKGGMLFYFGFVFMPFVLSCVWIWGLKREEEGNGCGGYLTSWKT